MIPKQLWKEDFRFCLIRKQSKAPYEKEWQKNGYKFNDTKLLNHLYAGGNYGVIGGYGNLRILDKDGVELDIDLDTLAIKTGSGGTHYYFLSDYDTNHVFINELGELRANNYQCVGAGSMHPNGKKYEILKDIPLKFIPKEEIEKIIKPYLKGEQTAANNSTGRDTSRSGKEFYIIQKLIKKDLSKETIFEEMKMYSKWNVSPPQYKEMTFNKALAKVNEEKLNKREVQKVSVFTIKGQVEIFYQDNPFFYDKSGMFWVWNNGNNKYELSDEVDLLNGIAKIGVNTINSKTKGEIITAIKQHGRKNIPEKALESWVQFKDKIYDFIKGDLFKATPDYFITNPIPWEIGELDDTPEMDKLFIEWVGEENVKTLYEIIAYTCSSDQFMQRLIALVGGGANGKGTFLKLLMKFVGLENTSTSELKELASNQFETSAIYKKLLCVMGEVSYDDLKNTNQIKKLSGEDQIRFCYKGKTPFSEKSITTIISATNSLPRTPDKTLGFYRKWLILDFPNQFPIKSGILNNIPDEEYNNLAKKVLIILKELYSRQTFTNEGDFEERIKRYEERSNPVLRFVESNCIEDVNHHIPLRHFGNVFNEFAKERHLRLMTIRQVSKILREEGFDVAKRNIEDVSKVVILNLNFKDTITTKTTINPSWSPCKVSTENHGSLSSLGNLE